jgi:glycosyltransferase involved in cell wall biosynthesis
MDSQSNLKVAIIAPSTRSIGGQSAQALYLFSHWKGDPQVSVKLIESDPKLPRILHFLEGVPFARTIVRFFVLLTHLWSGLRDVQVAHIFSASYWAFVLVPTPALLLAKLRGVKTIIHYHSGEARDHLKRWPSARRFLRRADCVVVPSGYLAAIFTGFGICTTVVSNGINCENFRFRHREPLRPQLICTRAFEPYYRVDLVIRAFSLVKKEFPEARITLVGSGTLSGPLHELVNELGIQEAVEFAGAVKNEEIHKFYDVSDIFVNASEVDNMPVSVLEAFASGTVVVSTSPGGIPYMVENGKTGLLSEPGTEIALAQNIVKILREPDLAKALAIAAFEESRQRTWPVLREQWLGIYEHITGKGCGVKNAS